MCGFVGFVSKEKIITANSIENILKSMNDTIVHRGPDSEGYWVDSNLGLGLAHRRLSIIDLSKFGSQPMISENGRYILVYNGEIYNHKELFKELKDNCKDIVIKGHSDTEI